MKWNWLVHDRANWRSLGKAVALLWTQNGLMMILTFLLDFSLRKEYFISYALYERPNFDSNIF